MAEWFTAMIAIAVTAAQRDAPTYEIMLGWTIGMILFHIAKLALRLRAESLRPRSDRGRYREGL